jgi:hypothetical protein
MSDPNVNQLPDDADLMAGDGQGITDPNSIDDDMLDDDDDQMPREGDSLSGS